MEAATAIPIAQVRTRGDRLLIDNLQVTDECAVRLARACEEAGDDLAKAIVDAIGIGARVLDREQAHASTDFVRAEFERAARELDAEFVERARLMIERLDTKLGEVFAPESGQVTRLLERHFGDDSQGAVQNRVREVVGEIMAKSREDLVRQFSSADGNNPLADFKAMAGAMMKQASDRQAEHLLAMTKRLEDMRVELAELRAERENRELLERERERGTAKGRTYEELVRDAVDQLAVVQGDACEAVGDIREGTGKAGDIVVAIDAATGPPRGRIVFEAKDRQLSRPKALEELDRALEVRSADYAILVVPTEDEVPARMLPLREYNGDKLIVAFDPGDGSALALRLAYSLARARVVMSRGDSGGVDAAAVSETVERALAAMDDVRRIKQQLTGAKTQIDKASELVEAMAARVRAQLAEIDALVAASGEQP
jgi:hypothetical protein